MEYDLSKSELESLKAGETVEIGKHSVGKDEDDGDYTCLVLTDTIRDLSNGEEKHWGGGDRDLTLTYGRCAQDDQEAPPEFDTFGQTQIITCLSEVNGSNRIVQMWKAEVRDDFATVSCYVGDANYLVNTTIPDVNHDHVVKDRSITSWDDLPDEIYDTLTERLDVDEDQVDFI